jgi:hypothetical protein
VTTSVRASTMSTSHCTAGTCFSSRKQPRPARWRALALRIALHCIAHVRCDSAGRPQARHGRRCAAAQVHQHALGGVRAAAVGRSRRNAPHKNRWVGCARRSRAQPHSRRVCPPGKGPAGPLPNPVQFSRSVPSRYRPTLRLPFAGRCTTCRLNLFGWEAPRLQTSWWKRLVRASRSCGLRRSHVPNTHARHGPAFSSQRPPKDGFTHSKSVAITTLTRSSSA